MPISGCHGDPRAAERTFQLLCAGGGAGRARRASEPAASCRPTARPPGDAGDRVGRPEAFYDREISERERSALPPFGRLAGIIVSAATRPEAESHARGLRRTARVARTCMCLARPRRRWPWSAAATASGCSSRPTAAPTSRATSRRCWQPAQRCAARCGCRSTSTRKASCDCWQTLTKLSPTLSFAVESEAPCQP